MHNVHCLVHIANEVRKYVWLDNISAFPFENLMKSINKGFEVPWYQEHDS